MSTTHPTRRSTAASAASANARIATGSAYGLDGARPAGPRPMVSEPGRMVSTDTAAASSPSPQATAPRRLPRTPPQRQTTSHDSAVMPLTPPPYSPASPVAAASAPRPWAAMPSGMSEAEESADPHLAEAMRASMWLSKSKGREDSETGSAQPLKQASAPAAHETPSRPSDATSPGESEDAPPLPPKAVTVVVPTPNESELVTATEDPEGTVTVEEEGATPPATPAKPHRPRAVTKLNEVAEGKKPIDATVYLDPCLRNTLFTVPAAVRGVTDTALTAASAYGDGSFNWTTGAPIGGMAALAKGYVLPPDVKVEAENGGVTLRLAVIDETHGGVDPPPRDKDGKVLCDKDGRPLPGKPRGRTKARVEVGTYRGGVELDLLELDANRQIDIKVETGKGDVQVLLPSNFHGPVHITAPDMPAIGPILQPQCAPVVNPYENVWTTHIVPLGQQPKRGSKRSGGVKHGLMKAIANYVPDVLREQDEYHDMAFQGIQALQKGTHSKLVVKTERGKVAVGYRDSADVAAAAQLRLIVGAKSKSKHWWTL